MNNYKMEITMDDIQELAEALGKDTEELYEKIKADMLREIDRSMFALFPMLLMLREIYQQAPKHFVILLDLLCEPELSTRELARRHRCSQSLIVKVLKQVEGRWGVDLSVLPGRARVLPSVEGQK